MGHGDLGSLVDLLLMDLLLVNVLFVDLLLSDLLLVNVLFVDGVSCLPVSVPSGCARLPGVWGWGEPGDAVAFFDYPVALVDGVVVA